MGHPAVLITTIMIWADGIPWCLKATYSCIHSDTLIVQKNGRAGGRLHNQRRGCPIPSIPPSASPPHRAKGGRTGGPGSLGASAKQGRPPGRRENGWESWWGLGSQNPRPVAENATRAGHPQD